MKNDLLYQRAENRGFDRTFKTPESPKLQPHLCQPHANASRPRANNCAKLINPATAVRASAFCYLLRVGSCVKQQGLVDTVI